MKNELIDRILLLEYAMFQQVPNRNGRAACQDNWATFRIMRSSQFSAWTPEMCRLYLTCLQAAWSQGRNLVQEKYGWMMADTLPGGICRPAERAAACRAGAAKTCRGDPGHSAAYDRLPAAEVPAGHPAGPAPISRPRASPNGLCVHLPAGRAVYLLPAAAAGLSCLFAAAASPAAQSAPGDPGIHGPPIWVRRSGCI